MALPILKSLNLQSKLLATLLTVSLVSMLLTGFIAYSSGQDTIRQTVTNQLTGFRAAKADEIEAYFNNMEQHILTLSEASMTIDSIQGFTTAFQNLRDKPLDGGQRTKLTQFYEKDFLPALSNNVEGTPSVFSYLPSEVNTQYLQYHYVAANPNSFAEKAKLDNPRDGSDYSKLHALYHPRFKRVAERMGYQDLILFDPQGNMVYAVAKQPDFATNIRSGPYAQSNLAEAFQVALRSADPNFVSAIDFQRYRANLGLPTSFITTTVFDYTGKFIGVLVAQIDSTRIDKIMTSNQNWAAVGLGKTGETLLFGQDYKLRSPSRLFIEDAEQYFKALETRNYPPEEVEAMRRAGSPITLMTIAKTPASEGALNNQTGIITTKTELGERALTAYQPVKLGNFRWGLIARIEEKEAFAGLNRLLLRLLVSTALIAALLTLLANYLARLFSSPIRKINQGLQRIAAGDTDVEITMRSDDEIADLGKSFNQMVKSIREKDDQIAYQVAENNRLLLNILPSSVAEELKSGQRDTIADNFPDVSVLYLEVEGFGELSTGLPPDVGLKLLNDLIGRFDELAEEFGVEKIKTIGASYLAVCGLSVPRIDHAKRAMDFAIRAIQATQTFNRTHQTHLSLDIGLHAGPVTAGVVGKTKFLYELWGETITIARAIHNSPERNIIQVTEEVYEILTGLYNFVPGGQVPVKGKGNIPVWALKPLENQGSAPELATAEG
jgi:class 3 adenylate cyclase